MQEKIKYFVQDNLHNPNFYFLIKEIEELLTEEKKRKDFSRQELLIFSSIIACIHLLSLQIPHPIISYFIQNPITLSAVLLTHFRYAFWNWQSTRHAMPLTELKRKENDILQHLEDLGFPYAASPDMQRMYSRSTGDFLNTISEEYINYSAIRKGVAAIIVYNSENYMLTLPQEDANKFEIILEQKRGNDHLNPESIITDFAYLRECHYGLISGGVDNQETLKTALLRELFEEVSEICPEATKFLNPANLKTSNFEQSNFLVAQFKDNSGNQEIEATQKMNTFRALFSVFFTKITISKQLFDVLKPNLQKIDDEALTQARPVVRAIYSQKQKNVNH